MSERERARVVGVQYRESRRERPQVLPAMTPGMSHGCWSRGIRAGSNRPFQVLDLYWISPKSGSLWYRSRQLKRAICTSGDGARVDESGERIRPPPSTLHLTPHTLHLTPHPSATSYTQHTTNHTLHPTHHNLRLTPDTRHLTPYALHPTPYVGNTSGDGARVDESGERIRPPPVTDGAGIYS